MNNIDKYLNFDLPSTIFDDTIYQIVQEKKQKINNNIIEYTKDKHKIFIKMSIILSIISIISLTIGMIVWADKYSFSKNWISDIGLTQVNGKLNTNSFILFSLSMGILAFQEFYIGLLCISVSNREPFFISLSITQLFSACCTIILIIFPLDIDQFKHDICAIGIYIGIFISAIILVIGIYKSKIQINKNPIYIFYTFIIIIFILFIIAKIYGNYAEILQKIYIFSALFSMTIYISIMKYL